MLFDQDLLIDKHLYYHRCKEEKNVSLLNNAEIWLCSKAAWAQKSSRLGVRENATTSIWLKAIMKSKSSQACNDCNGSLERIYHCEVPLPFIPLQAMDDVSLELEHCIS